MKKWILRGGSCSRSNLEVSRFPAIFYYVVFCQRWITSESHNFWLSLSSISKLGSEKGLLENGRLSKVRLKNNELVCWIYTEKMGLKLKGIFLPYFNHLKLFPSCSGIKRIPRKQAIDFGICCSSSQHYVTGTAALQQLFYPSSRNKDKHVLFVKCKQNALFLRE